MASMKRLVIVVVLVAWAWIGFDIWQAIDVRPIENMRSLPVCLDRGSVREHSDGTVTCDVGPGWSQ